MFDLVDQDSDRGRVYRALVANPNASTTLLAERTGLAPDAVRAAIDGLSAAGAVTPGGAGEDVWEAQRPDLIAAAALRAEDARRAQLRDTEAELAQLFWLARRERGQYSALEVIDGPQMLLGRIQRLQADARVQVCCVKRPPYASDNVYRDGRELKRAQMAKGVRYRTIYHEAAFDEPGLGASMLQAVAEGEQARVLKDPPIKLILGDDKCAVLPVDPTGAERGMSLLIHPCGLLTSLINVFETLWRLAMPASTQPSSLDERDREIITLMAAGATDDAIARRLRLSRRTVVRRAAALLDRLGATTRFQAGVQAARRGWL